MSLICDEWVKFRFFKESWRRQSFKLFIHEARYNRICILINGYWSLRFWIESSNKYPAGHESTISKLSRLVWDINFLSHRFYVPTRRSLWSIQIFILTIDFGKCSLFLNLKKKEKNPLSRSFERYAGIIFFFFFPRHNRIRYRLTFPSRGWNAIFVFRGEKERNNLYVYNYLVGAGDECLPRNLGNDCICVRGWRCVSRLSDPRWQRG